MHVVELDPQKQIDAEASWEMTAEAMDRFNFHDDIFKRYSERQRLTRSKTREDRRTRSQEWSLQLSDPGEPEKLQQVQREDESIRSCLNQCTGLIQLSSYRTVSSTEDGHPQERETSVTAGATTTVYRASAQTCLLCPLSRSPREKEDA